MMIKKCKIAFFILLGTALFLAALIYMSEGGLAVMTPKGLIALKQRELIITSTWLMLIVVIPTMILAVVIAWHYRKENAKAKYSPEWDDHVTAEVVWWGVPCIIVFALSVLVWKSSHELDPFRPLESDRKPLVIQVVALQWKWLFIYPEQNIATVNYIELPIDIPITFDISADAPMNSFWIPQLGGQIYAMPGMKTKLHLIANEEGSYRGSSANLSGSGFSGMTFTAKGVSEEEFEDWVGSVRGSPSLDWEGYRALAVPSSNNPVAYYSLGLPDLYDRIVMQFMPMEHNGN